jgi:general stress protein YciG
MATNKDFNPAQNLDQEARRRGGQNSPGNFKNDPERAAEAGRKGGRASHGNNNNR